jgi:hypothetical protein
MLLVFAEAKAEKLNVQKKMLDEVMKKTQDIIDQMLPKQISAVSSLIKTITKNYFFIPVVIYKDFFYEVTLQVCTESSTRKIIVNKNKNQII